MEFPAVRAREVEEVAVAERFASLLDAAVPSSYRLAAVLLGSATEAEDAVQDAAVGAWRDFGTLRDEKRFEAWFARILINKCRDRLRKRRSLLWLDVSDDYHASDASDPGKRIPEHDAIQRCLAALRPEHRAVLVLRYFSDLSLEAIADQTGERIGTVKSRLHYALEALRAAYEAAERSGGKNL